MGSGAMVVAILQFSHDELTASKSSSAPKRQTAASGESRVHHRAPIFYMQRTSFNTTSTVSLIPLQSSCTPSSSSHRAQWHRPLPAWPGTLQNDSAFGPPPHAHPSPAPATEEQSQPHHLAIMPHRPTSLPNKPVLASFLSTSASATL